MPAMPLVTLIAQCASALVSASVAAMRWPEPSTAKCCGPVPAESPAACRAARPAGKRRLVTIKLKVNALRVAIRIRRTLYRPTNADKPPMSLDRGRALAIEHEVHGDRRFDFDRRAIE